ncbi:Oligopeptide ABC superfamily ATP binding cassette transporter, binding protein [Lactobacillus equicursoris 66c]|uniref:Oligopeptide ABC superfamily ATP binding cassette transporter, binding protein n=1 Tax=Lactobacillus equicursoris 66c TaxID=872326 RepID=K0NQ71_9LACO|nr:peptide ABC transporter substrate-binding protein [Lactobacillus equicursoris]CCK83048.1 Oligopeptide ABC superfamily ATP binding cassette transporter, binding protein [Lactobacillus equicursoris 66c]
MRKGKLFATGSVTLAAAALLAACGSSSSSSSSKPQKLAWTEAAELTTMDPSKATDRYDADQFNNVMEGLIRLSNNAKATPGMATSWKESKDGKTWTFNLRKGAKWSNGDEVTANDFVYSWRRTVNPKTASEYAYLFSGVKNADQIVAGKKAVNTLGIKADGKYKLTVTLERRIPYFKLLMGFYIFFPQNQKFVEKCGSKYGTAAKYVLSNGPFKMTGWTGSNLTWKLVKNNTYWDKKNVKLDQVSMSVQKTQSTSYNLYQSGKLDETNLDAQQSKQLKGTTGWTVRKFASTKYLQYNIAKDKNLANANLRKAISLAINKKQLATTVGAANQAAVSFTAAGITDSSTGKDFSSEVKTSATQAVQGYDKVKAKEYYKKALKELGKKSITIQLLGDDTDDAKKVTEFIQSALESTLGMKVEVTNVPFKTRLSRVSALKFDVVATGWTADFSDPISFLDLLSKGNAYNYGKWESTTYNKNVSLSKTTGSTAARWKAMVKADQALVEDQGVTPLYYTNEATLVKTKVKGVVFNGAGAPYNFKEAYIK